MIIAFAPMVQQIIYKYSKRTNDEDLYQECMMKVCECVDDCYLKGVVEESEIKARCYVWVRNKVIDRLKQYEPDLKDDDYWITIVSKDDGGLSIMEKMLCMDNELLEVFKNLRSGKTEQEILKTMGIGKTKYKRLVKQLKEMLNDR
jgi:DNA-directed RNA polymerase specialized sigma24 family protein